MFSLCIKVMEVKMPSGDNSKPVYQGEAKLFCYGQSARRTTEAHVSPWAAEATLFSWAHETEASLKQDEIIRNNLVDKIRARGNQ
jgi:hypothetical protein